MSPVLRVVLLVISFIFTGMGTWQYFGYRYTKEETFHFWVSVICLIIAMVGLLAFFLTKPKDDISDISITKP